MSVDRRSIKVLLAALEIEQQELAERMGYEPRYVANIFGGCTPVSDGFKSAFGVAVAELLLGPSRTDGRKLYATGPLNELISIRAAEAASKREFYNDLGLSPQGWNKRTYVTAEQVDRICCALGVHPSALYGRDFEVGEAS